MWIETQNADQTPLARCGCSFLPPNVIRNVSFSCDRCVPTGSPPLRLPTPSCAGAFLYVKGDVTRRTATRGPHTRLNIIPNLPTHLCPIPITRRAAYIPASPPLLVPVDVLRKAGVGGLDSLRDGNLVVVAPTFAVCARYAEAAEGGSSGGGNAVGAGLRVTFVPGDGTGVAAGLECVSGVDGGGGREGDEGEGSGDDVLEIHDGVYFLGASVKVEVLSKFGNVL